MQDRASRSNSPVVLHTWDTSLYTEDVMRTGCGMQDVV